MASPSERHNAATRIALTNIVKPIIDAGGTTSEVMVVLESVVAGVLLACERLDGKDARYTDGMLMGLEEGVRSRLDVMRRMRAGKT